MHACHVQLPEALEPAVCRMVHHATSRLPDLLSAVAAALQGSFQPGERVLGLHDGRTLPCRVVTAQPQGDGDGGAEQVGPIDDPARMTSPHG